MSESGTSNSHVMPGQSAKRVFAQMPGHPRLLRRRQDVDGRDKPGHDGVRGGRRRFLRIAVSLAFVLIV